MLVASKISSGARRNSSNTCRRDYRVHVVGDAVFATEIVSDADDYRYAARQGEDAIIQTTSIPLFVADRCRPRGGTWFYVGRDRLATDPAGRMVLLRG
jgi:hypothetical protein